MSLFDTYLGYIQSNTNPVTANVDDVVNQLLLYAVTEDAMQTRRYVYSLSTRIPPVLDVYVQTLDVQNPDIYLSIDVLMGTVIGPALRLIGQFENEASTLFNYVRYGILAIKALLEQDGWEVEIQNGEEGDNSSYPFGYSALKLGSPIGESA